MPTLPTVSADRLPSALREAVATEWERGTLFLFTPVMMAAGALTYFAVDREPYLATAAAFSAEVEPVVMCSLDNRVRVNAATLGLLVLPS